MYRNYYKEVYISTVNKLVLAALISVIMVLHCYLTDWSYVISALFYWLCTTVMMPVSVSYAFCLFVDNWGVVPRIAYSKKQKALVVFLAVIPILSSWVMYYSI